MIKELIKLSNHLDAKGLRKESNYLDAVIRKIANPLHGTNPTNQPRAVPSQASSLDQLMGQLNLSLKKLRDAANKDNHDRIVGTDYIAKGFGVGKFIDQALEEWNAENDTKFASRTERLGVGEGVKITWVPPEPEDLPLGRLNIKPIFSQ